MRALLDVVMLGLDIYQWIIIVGAVILDQARQRKRGRG